MKGSISFCIDLTDPIYFKCLQIVNSWSFLGAKFSYCILFEYRVQCMKCFLTNNSFSRKRHRLPDLETIGFYWRNSRNCEFTHFPIRIYKGRHYYLDKKKPKYQIIENLVWFLIEFWMFLLKTYAQYILLLIWVCFTSKLLFSN